MASDEIRTFWNDGVRAERERVMLRISQGTKGSSPAILSASRMNPGYYFNPLPDNSSGSKIRLFESNKDESGRPNAMELVAMRQRGNLSGGVLKDYRYAKTVLNRRAIDTANQQLEAQGLPATAEPIVELTAVESRNLELNTLLQGVQDAIEAGNATSLTVNELRNIPRLLIVLTPTYTPAEAVELIRFIDDDILEILREQNLREPAVVGRLTRYFEAVRRFLEEMMPFLGLDAMTKQRASSTIGKRIFGRTIKLAEGEPVVRPPPRVAPAEGAQPREGGEPAVAPVAPPREGGEPAVAPVAQRRRPQLAPAPAPEEELEDGAQRIFDNLRTAYRRNDVETLREWIEDNTNLRAEKYFNSRTTMANVILNKSGVDIRRFRQ